MKRICTFLLVNRVSILWLTSGSWNYFPTLLKLTFSVDLRWTHCDIEKTVRAIFSVGSECVYLGSSSNSSCNIRLVINCHWCIQISFLQHCLLILFFYLGQQYLRHKLRRKQEVVCDGKMFHNFRSKFTFSRNYLHTISGWCLYFLFHWFSGIFVTLGYTLRIFFKFTLGFKLPVGDVNGPSMRHSGQVQEIWGPGERQVQPLW